MNPNYKCIYTDIISEKYPEKISDDKIMTMINQLSTPLDILQLNNLIFDKRSLEDEVKNQKLRSFDKDSILKILDDQRKNNLNNSQVARKFKLSRNTITKWKKIFPL